MKERLYRSRKDRVFGGVAAGLADYLNIDPILVRIIFVIITFLNGVGLLLYIIMWIVVPEEQLVMPNFGQETASEDPPSEEGNNENTSADNNYTEPNFQNTYEVPKKSGNSRMIGGAILIGVGVLFLTRNLFPFFDFADLFPVILMLVGGALIFNSIRNKKGE